MNIELIIKGLLFAWMVTNFSPFQDALKTIRDKSPIWLGVLFSVLNCIKCVSFWSTFALTGDVWSAILAAVIAATYDRIMNSFRIFI